MGVCFLSPAPQKMTVTVSAPLCYADATLKPSYMSFTLTMSAGLGEDNTLKQTHYNSHMMKASQKHTVPFY